MADKELIQKTVELAKRGWPEALPNPLVGCVIVKKGRVIAEGYHKKFGGPHAEIEALREARGAASGAALYVNLEPCSHWGKTPPCVDTIIKAKVAHVVAGCKDPNPQVSGQGFNKLKRAGIKVSLAKNQNECRSLNLPFFTQISRHRPYIVLKAAASLDGKIADFEGNSKWITDKSARELVWKLRSRFDAILVGAGTVIKDDPQLTSHGRGKNPTRIILDPHNRVPKNAKVLTQTEAPTIIVQGQQGQKRQRGQKSNSRATILSLPIKNGYFNLASLLEILARKNIQSLLVEGGPTTHATFVEAGLFDELLYFFAPKILGGKASLTPVEGHGLPISKALKLGKIVTSNLGNTILIRASNIKNGLLWSLLDDYVPRNN